MPAAFITGCSRGIGHETALDLRARGWDVTGTLRGDAGRAALEAAGVHVATVDVTDEPALRAAIDAAAARHDRLDALIANAGRGIFGPFEQLTSDEVRALFEVNLFGALSSARAALPHLRASRGRLVIIGSIAGRRSAPCSGIYNASKFALEGWAESLRHEMIPFGVHVVLIQPGGTATGFHAAIQQGARVGEPPYGPLVARVRALQAEVFDDADPAQVVVDAIWRALSASAPPLRIATGVGTRVQLTANRLLPWRVWELLVRQKMKLPKG
jgi:NAD(P)-dependent dehydrogenase (short-subunit alcohol dehydrogenase family)